MSLLILSLELLATVNKTDEMGTLEECNKF